MTISIRPLSNTDITAAHLLLSELRSDLSHEALMAALSIQKKSGYFLVGAFDPEMVGVIGLRPVHTLARGWHIHIDDLVVTQRRRKQGVGKALLDFAENEARKKGFSSLFLDAVEDALGFYTREGYHQHIVTLMKKNVIPTKEPLGVPPTCPAL
jgi:GNAT superfamily N-acetyltransferase